MRSVGSHLSRSGQSVKSRAHASVGIDAQNAVTASSKQTWRLAINWQRQPHKFAAMADPMEVWYRLCNEKGEELGDLSSIPITPEVRNVDKLRQAVWKEWRTDPLLSDWKDVNAGRLKVYASEAALKADIDSNTTLKGLDSREKLEDLKDTEQHPLQIVVPDRVQPTTSGKGAIRVDNHCRAVVDDNCVDRLDSEGRLESRLYERLLPKFVHELRKQEAMRLKKFSSARIFKLSVKLGKDALEITPSIDDVQPFNWGPKPEPDQAPECIKWLKNALKFDLETEVIIEKYNETRKAKFTFPLRARTDLRVVVASNSVCFIELTKQVDKQAERQAIAEACLFLRDPVPEKTATGVIILTDLRDSWKVLFFTPKEGAKKKELRIITLDDRKKGLGALKMAVLLGAHELHDIGITMKGFEQINREVSGFPESPLKKRIKLVHISPETSQLIQLQDLAESAGERSLLQDRLFLSLFKANCEPEEQKIYHDAESGLRDKWLTMYL
ncbi:hypothetical protein DFS34DRAFT_688239 [Phlyctochytrium arcticum]|nr:hypothetical protein DFS34DRAFT_688239 [Phlyctochytrium arcticum]